jgi:hypothetical protein
MANLFRRIYDWLLRLFWYAYLCPHRRHAPVSMPGVPCDIAHQDRPWKKQTCV